MCPMCLMRTALLAVAAVSTGGLATIVAARVGLRRARVSTNRDDTSCRACDNTKER